MGWKANVWIYQVINKRNLTSENLDRTKKKKRNCISSNSSKNNAIRPNYVKTKLDKTQQNNKCRLSGDRDETIDQIMSECNVSSQKRV